MSSNNTVIPCRFYLTSFFFLQYLFKIHCDRYFEILKPHFETLLTHKEDSFQLCAAEMLAGIMMGIKIWPFDKAQRLIQWCVPLLRKIIDNMTVETQKHWGSAIAIALVNSRLSPIPFDTSYIYTFMALFSFISS